MELNSGQNPRMDWAARDLATAFKRFKEHSEFMFGGPLDKKSEEVKCNYLMLWIGEKGREIFSTWDVSDADKKKLKTYMDGFEAYCKPKTNLIYNRYMYKSRTQNEGESFEEFVTELRLLIKDCAYPADMQDDQIRDHIVFGIRSNQIREKLIREGSELTLERCIDIARTHELSQAQCKAMDEPSAVHAVKQPKGAPHRHTRGSNRSKPAHQQNPKKQQHENCNNCGLNHGNNKCPANGETCHCCAKSNHFAKMCRKTVRDMKQRKVNEVNNTSLDLDCPDFLVNSIEHDKISNQAFVKVGIGKACLRMKIDTGAQVNVIPRSQYMALNIKGPLQYTNKRLTAYGGKALTIDGYRKLPCTYKNKTTHAEFYIVDSPGSSPILGLETCLSLGLINLVLSMQTESPMTKQSVLTTYAEVFDGIGKLKGQCEIRIRQGISSDRR